jgi:hypothetical protein
MTMNTINSRLTVLMKGVVLVFERAAPNTFPAFALVGGITALDHKPFDISMEFGTIVVS